jgi:hypothetical protein
MSDERLRKLERNGEWEHWHAGLLRAGLLTIYSEPIGPPSILEAKCANDDCDRPLKWSNCSYCDYCHGAQCGNLIIGSEDIPRYSDIGIVMKGQSHIAAGRDYPCEGDFTNERL